MADLLDYSGLYQLLGKLVAAKRTCTLHGRTDNNRSVMIGILGGRIITLICAGKRGGAAIPALRQVESMTFRLDDAVAQGGMELPPTAEILAALKPSAGDREAPAVAALNEVAQGSAGGGPELCELLSRFLGPISPVVCSETIRAAGGLDGEARRQRVILDLAREIEDEAEATEFLESARKILGVS